MISLKEIAEGTRCWKGYEKKGMKTMFGKRVPNCVKRENAVPDHDGKAAPYGSGYDEMNEDPTKGGLGKWFRLERKKAEAILHVEHQQLQNQEKVAKELILNVFQQAKQDQ
jgi:hypothetical protein